MRELPWMTDCQIQHIKELLFDAAKSRDILECLEWGSGGSTLYFTRFMTEQGIDFIWTTIEYDLKWYKAVVQATAGEPRIVPLLFEVSGEKPLQTAKRRDFLMDDYVDYPLTTGKKFDFILVDGRKRRRCLQVAATVLAERGVAVLHDASRTYYHCALAGFPESSFLGSDLWIGRLR